MDWKSVVAVTAPTAKNAFTHQPLALARAHKNLYFCYFHYYYYYYYDDDDYKYEEQPV